MVVAKGPHLGQGCGVVTEQEQYFIRGERLEERRKKLGLTQEAAAERAGLNVSYWSQLENNKVPNPSLGTLRKAAAAVHTSVSYLIGETDDPRPIVAQSEPLHNQRYWEGGRGELEPEDILILERAFLEVMERRRRRRAEADGGDEHNTRR